jgi:D-alanyl-D-alanine carboxypeptidase/D-alanyl-D-alanine-endopeptidase (penicillin-binding protein 4)
MRSFDKHALRAAMTISLASALLGASLASPSPLVQPAVGGTPWTADRIAKLDADLDAMLASDPALHGAHYGVYAIDTASGSQLYAHASDDQIQPASTLKLLVGSAALDRLTPQFSWTTSAALTSAPGSREEPELIVTAVGDPTLATSDVVDAVSALKVARIADIRIDDSAFDDRAYAAGWTWDDFGEDYAPSISAATLDENVVEMRVTPGGTVGSLARVSYADGRPSPSSFAPCDAYAGSTVRVESRVTTGPAGSDDTVDATQDGGRCPEVIGSIPLGAASETIDVSMFRPIANMHDAFLRALAAANVRVTVFTSIEDGLMVETLRPPPKLVMREPFWTHVSKPLAALLGPRFWIPSDNLFGELLLKDLGLVTAGKPGTTNSGIAYEKQWLQSIGIDTATVTLADGCGMSQYDRITPRDLVTILQHDWNGPNRQLVLDSLPVGGARGTIEGIAGTGAAGRVFAKTGSMMHVRGLAGYLATLHHGAVTFAFEVDDWNGAYPALAALRARVLSRIIDD